jgi:SAM-dependent methyltransferase
MAAPVEHEAYVEMADLEAVHWWFRGRRAVLESVVSGLRLPEDARILELGSGTGGNFAMLRRFGRLTAVEANDAARGLSLRKCSGAVPVLSGSLPNRLPEFAQPFDLVCLFDVLEHVEDDEESLAVIRRLLAPGGIVLITVPAFALLWGPHDERMHHRRRYAKSELAAKLRRAGFRIERLSYINMFLFPAAVAARIADRLARALNKRRKANGSDLPPEPLNRIMAAIFGAERHLLARMNLPVGLSLLAVAQADSAARLEQRSFGATIA